MKIKSQQLSKLPRLFLVISKIAVMYTSLFILLFLDSGFYSAHNMSGTLILLINLAAVLGLVITSGTVLKIKTRLLFLYTLILAIVFISGIFFSNLKQTLIITICVTAGFAVANFIDYERFKKIYKETMLLLAVFSLITFLLWIFFPAVIKALPVAKYSASNYHNAIFSVISTSSYTTRNMGMFWEPGAFAIFLNIALLFEMTDKRQRLSKMLIFMITIATTLSTLGVICLAVLIMLYMFNKGTGLRNYKRNRIILIFVSIVALIYFLFCNEEFISSVFGKLRPESDGDMNFSTQTRLNALIYPFKAFVSSPFVGVGLNEFSRISKEYCFGMSTCTFLNWLSVYGIFGLIFVVGCIKTFLRHGSTVISKILLFLFSLLLFSTENYILIGFVYILVFYGFLEPRGSASK